MIRAVRNVHFFLFATLTACAASVFPSDATHRALPAASNRSARGLPQNLLYVTGGPVSSRHPFIEVFNALDKSSDPQPIYTIPPKEGGEYGLLAVDDSNNLYAVNYFTNAGKLLIFPPGETRPKINCLLEDAPHDTYIAQNVLYLTTAAYTVEEYSLPIHSGKNCPKPTTVLTDKRAALRGTEGLFGLAVDPRGDVFDVWLAFDGQRIDEFVARSKNARRFASLGQTYGAFYMASDSDGNLITNISHSSPQSNAIADFPHGSHKAKLFDAIPNGQYLGVALADHDTELFAAKDYPTTTVGAYAYDPVSGHVGSLLQTFSSNVWMYAQSIAVYSHTR